MLLTHLPQTSFYESLNSETDSHSLSGDYTHFLIPTFMNQVNIV